MIPVPRVDATLDSLDDDADPATVLADMLDDEGDWDWTDDSEHDPYDRLAVIESSGAYWLVYRGIEPDEARRFASWEAAEKAMADQRYYLSH